MALTEMDLDADFEKLDIKCTSTKCESGMHCFLPKPPRKKKGAKPQGKCIQLTLFEDPEPPKDQIVTGQCRSCGAQLVNWPRIHKRDLSDVAYTVEKLKLEMWRRFYWSRPFDQHAINNARRRGRAGLRQYAEKTIRDRLLPANPNFEFRQTRLEGNLVCYAQHATGTCCRKCLRYWHGIDNCHDLTEEQIAYATRLINHYIDVRFADLPEGGVKVPFIRTKKLLTAG